MGVWRDEEGQNPPSSLRCACKRLVSKIELKFLITHQLLGMGTAAHPFPHRFSPALVMSCRPFVAMPRRSSSLVKRLWCIWSSWCDVRLYSHGTPTLLVPLPWLPVPSWLVKLPDSDAVKRPRTTYWAIPPTQPQQSSHQTHYQALVQVHQYLLVNLFQNHPHQQTQILLWMTM